jgi:hypothetical protein
MNLFLKWWLIFILMILSGAVTWYFSFVNFLYANDFTKLSFVIIAILFFTTLIIGYKYYKNNHDFEIEWFTSEVVISLGMIGTVVGFIFMLYAAFSELTVDDPVKLQQSMMLMAKGMGTALLTTLVGLISSVLIKCQLIIAKNETNIQ